MSKCSSPDVYVLKDKDNRIPSPSIQTTVLAKYSRSPLSARDVIKTLSQEEADKFNSKWVVEYDHSSVAELATLPICFERVSMIAAKFLESFERGAYAEKSTRYQKFSRDSFYFKNDEKSSFVEKFYDAYEELYEPLLKIMQNKHGLSPDKQSTKARVFDSVRYLLPAGTTTNLVAVLNLRDLRYMINKALAHSNPEIVNLGITTMNILKEEAPAFSGKIGTDYADKFSPKLSATFTGNNPHYNYDMKRYRSGVYEYENAINISNEVVEELIKNSIKDIYGMEFCEFSELMRTRGKQQVPDVFKLASFGFDIMCDYAAYRDFQRHRRCNIYPELLSNRYGFEVPDDIKGTEIENKYTSVMESAKNWIGPSEDENQYVVPMGYLHRSIFHMDLKQIYYLTEIRMQPKGHISYRRIAYEMFRLASLRYPNLMQWLHALPPDSIGEHNLLNPGDFCRCDSIFLAFCLG